MCVLYALLERAATLSMTSYPRCLDALVFKMFLHFCALKTFSNIIQNLMTLALKTQQTSTTTHEDSEMNTHTHTKRGKLNRRKHRHTPDHNFTWAYKQDRKHTPKQTYADNSPFDHMVIQERWHDRHCDCAVTIINDLSNFRIL